MLGIGLGTLATALALVGTSRYGIGNSSDALAYISAAEGLRAGRGFTLFSGEPYIGWPPLYPALIAMLASVGMSAEAAARLLNAVLFGIVVSVSVLWSRKLGLSRGAAAWVGTAVTVGVPLFDLWRLAHSELLFIALVLAFAWLFSVWRRSGELGTLMLASAAAGLACLTRYAGVAAIMTGCLLLVLDHRKRVARGIALAAAFAIPAVLMNVPWAIRNAQVMGAPTGANQSPSPFAVSTLIAMTCDVVGRWVAPSRAPLALQRGVGAALLLLLIATFVWSLGRRTDNREEIDGESITTSSIHVLSGWIAVYTGFLIAVRAITFIDSDHARLLAPIYVPAVLVIGWLGWRVKRMRARRSKLAQAAILVIAAGALLWPIRFTAGATTGVMRNGAGGYATNAWQLSPTLAYVKSHRLTGTVYSNEANAVHAVAGLDSVLSLPEHDHPLSPISTDSALRQFREGRRRGEGWVVLFFSPELERNVYTARQVEMILNVRPIARFSDGAIYRLE